MTVFPSRDAPPPGIRVPFVPFGGISSVMDGLPVLLHSSGFSTSTQPRRDGRVGWRHDRDPVDVPCLRRRVRRRRRERRPGAPGLRRRRPARRRGRGRDRLVERQLQGRAGDDRRRQGGPDQPPVPGHRPRRRGDRLDLAGASGGAEILAHGYDLGVARHGGYAEYTRLPAGYVVPLPKGLTAHDAMAIGTAGFTAAMSVAALERHGLKPGDGPVLVTGASGGVGSVAVAILARRGHEVWAATGKLDEEGRLRELGAVGIVHRDECTAPSPKPLETARWAGAVDTVGAATLPYVLRTLRPGGAVASSGNASGAALTTTVLPFILRGVALLGMDSANMPIAERRALWARIATDLRPGGLDDERLGVTEVALDELESALDAILAGEARGRWVVRTRG